MKQVRLTLKKALSSLLAVGLLCSAAALSFAPAAKATAEDTETPENIALKYTGVKDENGFPTDWSSDDIHELKKIGDGTADTTAGSFALKWDEEAIYVKAEIADTTADGGNDQIRFLLDLDGKPAGEAAVSFGGTGAVNAGVFTWNCAPHYIGNADPVNAYDGGSVGAGTNILNTPAIRMSYADGKHTILAALRVADSLKAKLANGAEIGFDLRFNDFNGATGPDDKKMTTIGFASSQQKWNTDLREIAAVKLLNEHPVPDTPDEDFETATATAIYGTPEMDGKLNEWADVPSNAMRNVTENKAISGSFRLMWDEEAIYVAMQVTDDDENSSLIKVLFNMDGVPVGESRIMMSGETPLAAVYSVNWEGYGFGYVPTNAGFSYAEGAKGYDQTYAGNSILKGAMNICASYPTTYELKYTFNDAAKAKLKEGAKIGFDIMYLDSYGNTNTSDLGWATPYGKETFGLDLRKIGEVTLTPAPEIQPLTPTANAPKALAPGNGDIASTSVDLKWEKDDNAAGYDVLFFAVTEKNGETVYTFVKKEAVAGSTLTVSGLDPDTEYAFQVISTSEDGERLSVYELVRVHTLLSDPEDPGESEDPEDPDDSGNTGDADSSEDPKAPDNSDTSADSPNTGYADGAAALLSVLGIGAGAACVLLRKKRS